MLLDQYGRAFSLLDDIATREAAGEYFLNYLGVLPDPDPVLRKLGDDAAILADLEADDQVTAITMARKNRVLKRRDYQFKPGRLKDETASPEAESLCARLVKDLESLTMRDVISGILQAPFHGLAVLEITWAPSGGWWHIANVEAKPSRWFGFDDQNRFVFKGVYSAEPRLVPEEKFLVVRHYPTYENPYGLRLLSRCLWPVAFKKGGLKFYTRFLEKYGNPWAVGYAPGGASAAEMDKMAAQLAKMVREATAVLPYGSKLELASATGGQGDQHERYLKRMDAAISKVLMGNTLSSEIGDKGSYAAAETHKEVADDFAEADADLVVTALNDLAWFYARVNVGDRVLAPQFEYEEPADLDQLAGLDGKLHRLGVRFTAKHFTDKYSLAEDEFVMAEIVSADANDKFDFAAGADGPDEEFHQAIEAAVKQYAPEAAKSGRDFVSQVWKAVEAAESFEDLERNLAALLGATTGRGDFEELLGDLMVNAGLMGRWATAAGKDAAK